MLEVHGGVKFYRGAARAARLYVERDRSRADDYYLTEGRGVAERLVATPEGVEPAGSMTGDTYEQWVAGHDVDTGASKGRLREDGLRFVDTCGHLFEDRLDEVGSAMDAARAAAQARREALRVLPRVAPCCPVLPEPDFGRNDEAARNSVSAVQDRFSDWYPRPDSNRRYRLESTTDGAWVLVEDR